jgi:hypothetical protein
MQTYYEHFLFFIRNDIEGYWNRLYTAPRLLKFIRMIKFQNVTFVPRRHCEPFIARNDAIRNYLSTLIDKQQ